MCPTTASCASLSMTEAGHYLHADIRLFVNKKLANSSSEIMFLSITEISYLYNFFYYQCNLELLPRFRVYYENQSQN
jgi:hypothetical protein